MLAPLTIIFGATLMFGSGSGLISAARMAVLASRAAVIGAEESQVTGYVLVPGDKVLDANEVAATLSHMAKPIFCESTIVGKHISLDCHTIVESLELRRHQSQAAATSRILTEQIEAWSKHSNPLVEVRSISESLLSDTTTLMEWILDYDVRATMEVQNLGPAASKSKSGIVVKFSRRSQPGTGEIDRRELRPW